MNSFLTYLTNPLAFLIVFAPIVLVHEFGHLLAAKWLRVPVLEFGIGLPPRLVRLFKRGETEYTLNWIPVGGFVRLFGEEDPRAPDGFANAPARVRAPVLIAGVLMNLMLAFLVFSITAPSVPPYEAVQTTRIAQVVENSPAALAGLRAGDQIIALNGQEVKDNYRRFKQLLNQHAGRQVSLTILRGGEALDPIAITPRASPPAGEGPLGVALYGWTGLRVAAVAPGSVAERAGVRAGDTLVFFVDPQGRSLKNQDELARYTQAHLGWKIEWYLRRGEQTLGPISVQIPEALDPRDATLGLDMRNSATAQMFQVALALPRLLDLILSGNMSITSVGGPIAIYQLSGEVAQSGGALALLQLIGALSMSVAILNLLPFPGLDGGRLVFALLELVRGGKKIDPRQEVLVHAIGLIILLVFVAYISIFDLERLFSGKSLLNP